MAVHHNPVKPRSSLVSIEILKKEAKTANHPVSGTRDRDDKQTAEQSLDTFTVLARTVLKSTGMVQDFKPGENVWPLFEHRLRFRNGGLLRRPIRRADVTRDAGQLGLQSIETR
jgi:hypothetical protein